MSSHIPLKWWTHIKLCCVALQNMDNDFQHFMIIGILDRNCCQFSLELLPSNWAIDARCILSCDWMSPTCPQDPGIPKVAVSLVCVHWNFRLELPCMEHLSLKATYKIAKKFQWIHTCDQTLKVALDKCQHTKILVIVTTIVANKSIPNSRNVHWIFTNRQF